MNSHEISNIGPGVAKSIEIPARGLTLRVEGNGDLSPIMRDRFSKTPASLNGVHDPRLTALLKDFAAMNRRKNVPQSAYARSLAGHLGPQWTMSCYGEGSPKTVWLTLGEPGRAPSQTVDVNYERRHNPTLSLLSTARYKGCRIQQQIECEINRQGKVQPATLDGEAVVETAN